LRSLFFCKRVSLTFAASRVTLSRHNSLITANVLICHFVDRLVQINAYLGTLPGVYDSPKAIGKTKMITPFDEADLAQLILKMCPTEWQNQYILSQGIIPQDMRSLLETLEIIEKGENDKKPKANASGENKKSEDKKGGSSKKDSKRSGSYWEERAQKKSSHREAL
jgi:hypothetical protein